MRNTALRSFKFMQLSSSLVQNTVRKYKLVSNCLVCSSFTNRIGSSVKIGRRLRLFHHEIDYLYANICYLTTVNKLRFEIEAFKQYFVVSKALKPRLGPSWALMKWLWTAGRMLGPKYLWLRQGWNKQKLYEGSMRAWWCHHINVLIVLP